MVRGLAGAVGAEERHHLARLERRGRCPARRAPCRSPWSPRSRRTAGTGVPVVAGVGAVAGAGRVAAGGLSWLQPAARAPRAPRPASRPGVTDVSRRPGRLVHDRCPVGVRRVRVGAEASHSCPVGARACTFLPGQRTGWPAAASASLTSPTDRVPKWKTVAASTASAPASTAGGKCSAAPAPPLAITGTSTAAAHQADQLEVEAVGGAVGVHRVEQDLAGAQLGGPAPPTRRRRARRSAGRRGW